jgi:ketosteroid isomerase-like protein
MVECIMRYRTAVPAAFVLLLGAGCSFDQPRALDAEWPPLLERQSEFFEAMEAKDADGIAALFSEDAVVHVANMPPVEGREAIRQFYGNLFGFLVASNAVPEETHLSAGGDMAYGFGRTSNEFRGPEGPVGYAGKYALVWYKFGGEWMIVLYGVSSNEPAEAR